MNSEIMNYDVAIVGASIGGSSAAILFAQQGLRVALIERNKDINAYKIVCTHYIQPNAVPIIKRLGITENIEAAGGIHNGGRAWTRWGWLGSGSRANNKSYGYSIRREVLDPMLRRRAAVTPGVDFMPGTSLRELVYSDDRIVGLLEPEVAYALPNDSGLTLLAGMVPKSKLAEFKRDVQGNFEKLFSSLPDGPDLSNAEQASEMLGMLDMPNISRTTTAPGLGLVGDAALAPDPVWGNGCGWAFQSAQWLVDATVEALRAGHKADVDSLGGRFARDVDFSQARPFNFLERLMYSAAVLEPSMTRYTGPYSTRLVNIWHFPPLKAIVRAVWINLTARNRRTEATPAQVGAHRSSKI
jgi:flavin-dependent dehydrogenase